MNLRNELEEWALVTKNIKKRKENEIAQKWALATKIQKKRQMKQASVGMDEATTDQSQ